MKVLFLTSSEEDYLADGIFHGLRQLLGDSLVDYPKCEPMYINCPDSSMRRVRGHGFTLYRTLPDIAIDRHKIAQRVRSGEFDLVFFGNIHRLYGLFVEWAKFLPPEKTIMLDGEDSPALAPYAGAWWRRLGCWTWPRAHLRSHYFKREWCPETFHYRAYKLWPVSWSGEVYKQLSIKSVGFSIPEEKIVNHQPKKTQLFSSHVVDPEVSSRLGRSSAYQFSQEANYYADLQMASFAVTTRRAGWDCLRHYEISANGSVPCFRQLGEKPQKCAPHGLGPDNCIIYRDADDLFEQVSKIDPARYAELQAAAIKWVRTQTTTVAASSLLQQLG